MKIKRVPHLAYRPDITPTDFFMFGYIQSKLTEHDISDRQSLTNVIARIFDVIGQDIATTVFETWMNSPDWPLEHKGNIFINNQNQRKRFTIQREPEHRRF
jgi:hypothetical protein